MTSIKRFFAEWSTWFPSATASVLIFAFVFAAQLNFVGYYTAHNVQPRSVVGSVDDDAGWNTHKTMITRWYKDNGWALYGPLYFRINHTLQTLFPQIVSPEELSVYERAEQSAQYAIMITSTLSLFGLALLIGWALLESWAERLALAVVLVAAFLADGQWSAFILRAHPDVLFSIAAAAAAFYSLRMLDTGFALAYYRGSAVLWGLATCIKLSISLFLPGLILFVLAPFSFPKVKRALFYGLWMFAAYFVIGFPQTITLDRPVRDLLTQNQFSALGGWDTIARWLHLIFEQAWRPALVIVITGLVLGTNRFDYKARALGRMWAFAVVSTGLLVMRVISTPADHYTLPFVAIMLVLLAASVAALVRGRVAGTLTRVPVFLRASLLLVVFYPITNGYLPATLATELAKQQQCRPEAAAVDRYVRARIKENRIIFVDPYAPFPSDEKNKHVYNEWGISLKTLAARPYDVLILNAKFYGRFTPKEGVSEYVRRDSPDWESKRDAYLLFDGQQRAHLPDGQKWKLVSQDACGFQAWERE